MEPGLLMNKGDGSSRELGGLLNPSFIFTLQLISLALERGLEEEPGGRKVQVFLSVSTAELVIVLLLCC